MTGLLRITPQELRAQDQWRDLVWFSGPREVASKFQRFRSCDTTSAGLRSGRILDQMYLRSLFLGYDDPQPGFHDSPERAPSPDDVVSRVAHYNKGRPHSSLGPGVPEKSSDSPSTRPNEHRHRLPRDCEIRGKDILGGLHHEYRLEQCVA